MCSAVVEGEVAVGGRRGGRDALTGHEHSAGWGGEEGGGKAGRGGRGGGRGGEQVLLLEEEGLLVWLLLLLLLLLLMMVEGGGGGAIGEGSKVRQGQRRRGRVLLLLLFLLVVVGVQLLVVGGRGEVEVGGGTVGVTSVQLPAFKPTPSTSFPDGRPARIRRSSPNSHTLTRVMRPVLLKHFLRCCQFAFLPSHPSASAATPPATAADPPGATAVMAAGKGRSRGITIPTR